MQLVQAAEMRLCENPSDPLNFAPGTCHRRIGRAQMTDHSNSMNPRGGPPGRDTFTLNGGTIWLAFSGQPLRCARVLFRQLHPDRSISAPAHTPKISSIRFRMTAASASTPVQYLIFIAP